MRFVDCRSRGVHRTSALLILAGLLAACDGSRSSGPEALQEIPDPPSGFLRFVDIDAGYYSACGLTADSLTYCWGYAHVDGERAFARPVRVAVPNFGRISVGVHEEYSLRDMLCGVTGTREVVCRGRQAPQPRLVPGSVDFTALTVGGANCALAPDGRARCWKYDSRAGLIGRRDANPPAGTPVEVAGGRSFASLAAGRNTVCAITSGGELWCWGYNFALQIGDPSVGDMVLEPLRFQAPQVFASISIGTVHSCALTTAGRAWCWGVHSKGQLGRPDPPVVDCPGVSDMFTHGPMSCTAIPQEVGGGHTFTELAVGEYHACGIDRDGVAYCWGIGAWGQTGTGRLGIDNWSAMPQRVVGDLRFRRIVAGQFFTCALATNDATYCWGSNQVGQLGIGAGWDYAATVPHPVAAP